MKKKLSLLLVCCLILSMFAGCGNSAVSGGITSTPVPDEFDDSTTISETTIYDDNDILIKATELTYSSYALEIGISIENNSNEEYTFHSGYQFVIINGYTIDDGYLWVDVAAGKKAKETITISFDELKLLGIYDIQDLAIAFEIKDSNYDSIFVNPVTIPVSNDSSNSSTSITYQENIRNRNVLDEFNYTVEAFATDTIYDCGNVTVISECLVVNQYDETMLLLEVENSSSDAVYFWINKVQINDFMVFGSTNWSKDLVWPGTRKIVALDLSSFFSESYWEIYGIDKIGSIGLEIELTDIEYDTVQQPVDTTYQINDADVKYDKSGDVLYSDDDVKIVFKAIIDGEDDYDDGVYILLLAENTGDRTIILDEEYDTFAVNGYVSDCGVIYGLELAPGQCGMVEIYIYDYMFEDSGITCAADIESFEIEFEVNNSSYHELYTIVVKYP